MLKFLFRLSAVSALGFALASADAADADERFLILNGWSYHADRSAGFNEQNLGLGYAAKRRFCGTEAGFYRNSEDHRTLYLTGFCETGDQFRLGVWGGAATGYEFAHNALGLTGIGGLQFGIGPIVVKLSNGDGLVAFAQLRIPLD